MTEGQSGGRFLSGTVPKVAFVLPAGGSAGANQVGILASLVEHGIVPDLLVGSSVGALNAVFVADGVTAERVAELTELWLRLGRVDVFGRNRYTAIARVVGRQSHLCTPGPLRSLIEQFCPYDDLSDCPIRLQVATTDLDNGLARWWGRGPAREIVYASACLPGLLPPAVIDGHRHIDGGVLEPVPVQRAVDLDATTVYLLGEPPRLDLDPGWRMNCLEVLLRSFTISRYARLGEPTALARTGQKVIVVPGADTSRVNITNFSQTQRLMRDSREISSRFLSLGGWETAA